MNGNNTDIKLRKNLFQNDIDLCENEEKKTFLEYFDPIEKQFLEDNPTLFGNDDEKIKSNFLRKNNSVLSIIEEQKENYGDQKEKENIIDNEKEKEKESDNRNEQCLLNDMFCCDDHEHSLFRFNSNLHGFSNDNGLFGRQNSFNSLQLNI